MKGKRFIKYALWLVLIAIGYLVAVFLHPKVMGSASKGRQANVDISHLLSQPMFDINTGTRVSTDTLFSHERNLLVFWTPTCKFCRQFFQYRLNSYEVGIFCFPITDDLDYVRYYCDRNEVQYPNIGTTDSSSMVSVTMPTVNVVPTFVVLDAKGTVIGQHIGINGIDTLLDNLYNQKNQSI